MTDTFDLDLTAMAHGGTALGRHGRQVIFVPYAIPGERVRVRLVDEHARWAHAVPVEIVQPSPHRVQAPCPYFGLNKCGGCQWQHIDYEAQVEYKRSVLIDQMARVGGLDVAEVVEDPIGAAQPWHYRNQVQFHVTPEGELGFLTLDMQRIFPVKECYIIEPLLDELWEALDMEWPQLYRLSLRCGAATGERMAIFELNEYEDFDIEVDFAVSAVLMLADGEVAVMMGDRSLTEYVAGRDYRISAASSFQVNTGGTEALVAVVRDYLAARGSETLLDLYSGVGLFALALAPGVGRVVGIEADPGAAADYRFNAQGLQAVSLLEGSVEDVLPGVQDRVDLVVLDPPPSGAGEAVIHDLARLAPERVVYVSSDPATLARDASRLVGAGYHLGRLQLVDLYPQTFHMESVALFTRV
ncbi:MAG TPA: class I SAM-dependent RNA methyltransferase [Anaerolineae bacterium]|nr:class I SAM-dependent RNA methyltransferase [Anaerolineae bacterium]